MPCSPEVIQRVPLFALLDDEELAVLAARVELKQFAARQSIYKTGEPGRSGYLVVSGAVRVSTTDEDHQEVIIEEPAPGGVCGLASMLEDTPHQTDAMALEDTECVEIGRDDILALLQKKPHAGMDLLTTLSRQIHSAHGLVRQRAMRSPNEIIEEASTRGERIADAVARFGGSWSFIISFAVILTVYTAVNVILRTSAWDPYPFILLNLFLSMLAAIQAPIIMMSQNRQDTKDRVRSEMDFNVNRRAEAEVQGLSSRLKLVNDRIGDIEELLRKHLPAARDTRP